MKAEIRAYWRLLKVAFVALILAAVAITVVQLPDLRRYMKIRSM